MSRNGTPYHRLLNTARWRRLRASRLEAQPFCEDCRARGILTEATEVHHVVPVEHERNPERMAMRAFDEGNLASLCHACHAERHRLMRSHSREESQARTEREVADFWKRFG